MGSQGRQRPARDAIVESAIAHLAAYGPVGVQPQEICEELGISKALVNYHFGGREGLVAEAVATAYERHAEQLGELASRVDDGVAPSAALEALIEYQVRWGGDHPGLAAAAAFPDVAVGRSALSAEQQQRIVDAGARNAAAIRKVLVAARAELASGRGFASELESWQLTAIVGWVTLGMLSWHGGMVPALRTAEVHAGFDDTRQLLHALIRDALSR